MTDANQITPPKMLHPVFTGRLGAKNSLLTFAKDLDQNGDIYKFYALLDALGSANSTWKYLAEIWIPEGKSDVMHELLLNPAAIFIVIAESLFLVAFSLLASIYDKEKEYECGFKFIAKPNEPTSEERSEEKEKFDKSTYVLDENTKQLSYYSKKSGLIAIEINEKQYKKLKNIFTRPDIYGLLSEDELEEITQLTGHSHERSLKVALANAWPYFRDVLKALKNAYKGWRSVIKALLLLMGPDFFTVQAFTSTVLYGGIGLGILATINRLLLRKMVEDRKVMMDNNTNLLLTIKKLTSFSPDDLRTYTLQIKNQSLESRRLAFLGVTAGGLIDGLYLYMGVFSLMTLPQPWLIPIASMCVVYALACVVSRVYQEYDYQVRLDITRTKCQLVLLTKQIETLFNETTSPTETSVKKLRSLLHQFEAKRRLLQTQSTRTYWAAALLGIKNGLYAYSALTSVLFIAYSICILASASFPPCALIAVVILGLTLVAVSIGHSLCTTYWHSNRLKEAERVKRPYATLLKEMESKDEDAILRLNNEDFQEALQNGLMITPAPLFFYEEWGEILRSFFTGLNKGQKFVDFAGNPAQTRQEDGHFHDTPVMLLLGALNAALWGIVLACRALARGFGRPKIGYGLLKIPGKDPSELKLEDVEPLLNERCAILLFDNKTMYFADLKNNNLTPIGESDTLDKLRRRFSDYYKLADDTECGLIRTLTNQTEQTVQVEDDLAGAVGLIPKKISPTHVNLDADSKPNSVSSSGLGFFPPKPKHQATSHADHTTLGLA